MSEATEGCLASVTAKLVKTGTKILSLYICVEMNWAGVFGPFLEDFGVISKIISEIYFHIEINRARAFGPFLLDFGATRNIMPLAASLSSALGLQNIVFD